jgi:glycerol uptake facilitator-like aquaporin
VSRVVSSTHKWPSLSSFAESSLLFVSSFTSLPKSALFPFPYALIHSLATITQIVGGIVASALLQALLPGPLAVTPSLGDSTSKAQGVFIEMFLTSALVFAVLMLAAEKHRTTAFAPIGIGLTLFACHLWGVVFTGGEQ